MWCRPRFAANRSSTTSGGLKDLGRFVAKRQAPNNAKPSNINSKEIKSMEFSRQLNWRHNFVSLSVSVSLFFYLWMHRRTWQRWNFLMLFASTKTHHRNYLDSSMALPCPPHPLDPAEPSDVVVVQLLQNVLEKCFLAATAATAATLVVQKRWSMTIIYKYDEFLFESLKMDEATIKDSWRLMPKGSWPKASQDYDRRQWGRNFSISWAKPHHSLLESIHIKMIQNVPRPKSIGT
jgi:hypothetical protein